MHNIFNDGEVLGAMITLGIIAVAILLPNIIQIGALLWKELVNK